MPVYRVECTRILETFQRASFKVTAADEDEATELAEAADKEGNLSWQDDEEAIPEPRDEEYEPEETDEDADDMPEANAGTDADPGL